MISPEIEQRYASGISAHQAGRLAEAEAIYHQVLTIVPDADAVLTHMAALQYAQGNYGQAMHFADRALKTNPINLDALVNRASTLLAIAHEADALAAFESVIALQEASPTAHFHLADLHHRSGDLAAAEKSFRRAVALEPEMFQAHYALGNTLVELNRSEEACSAFASALSIQPDHIGLHHHLASAFAALGDWPAAWRQLRAGLEIDPKSPMLLSLKAQFLADSAQFQSALEAMDACLAIAPPTADRWVQKGNVLREMLRVSDARMAYERALQVEPSHEDAQRNLQGLLADQVPGWHFSMLADNGRNHAYETVLGRLVQPGDRVLDIGTGSGLLSMMAARAGASEVIACEREPAIAEVARTIIARNGYADRVKVYATDSKLLQLGKEVAEPVDLIVSEILDVALLGEGMLPSIRAALRSLAKPDAKVIPAAATVMVQLVELPESQYDRGLYNVEGFDLSEFERFRQSSGQKTLFLCADHDYGCSEILPLRRFDFLKPGVARTAQRPERFCIRFENVGNRNIDGILLWFELELDALTIRSSGPGGHFEHWGQAFYPLSPQPEPGVAVTIHCEMHDFGWAFMPGV
jgi:predicted RNA methylase/Tfp pilus assembly protein PilF